MREIRTENYERITKPTARKLFCLGEEIFMCANKVDPENTWGLLVPVQTPFDEFVRDFTYYNCNMEVGMYPAFYRRRDLNEK